MISDHQPRQPNGEDGGGKDRQSAIVRHQRAALKGDRGGARFAWSMTERLQARRAGSQDAELDVDQFDVLEDGSQGGTAVVTGVLLVRASLEQQDEAQWATLLQDLGHPTFRVRERIAVFAGKDRAEDLVSRARRLRALGHEASVDHIVPLGVITKGEGGPGKADHGWSRTAPDPGADRLSVALIDTGTALEGSEHAWHAGFAELWPDDIDLLDMFTPNGPGKDGLLDASAGHGAFAMGVVQQVDPGGRPRAYRAIDSDGIGSEVRVAEALLRAVEDGAEVINMSLGAQTVDDQPLLALQVAFEIMDEMGKQDVLIVAAAGNFGDRRPCWPAAFRRVVAVGALQADLRPAPWSSRGYWVDVSCVGEGIVSTYVQGKEDPELSPGTGTDAWDDNDPLPWAVWSGTSFAAPQIAAEVSRRLADARAKGGSATPRSIYLELVKDGTRRPDFGIVLQLLPGTHV